MQFDSAGGAAGRRDFEDPVLGPNPGSHFEPTALYPTVRPSMEAMDEDMGDFDEDMPPLMDSEDDDDDRGRAAPAERSDATNRRISSSISASDRTPPTERVKK